MRKPFLEFTLLAAHHASFFSSSAFMEHGPSDAGERGERRRTTKSKSKDSYKKFYADKIAKTESELPISNIFGGVQVYVEGYTALVPSLTLKKMIVLNGGKICRVFSKKKTTHMICTALSASKTESFMNRNNSSNLIHFVHPNWVLQSCKAGKLLPEESFSIVMKNAGALGKFFTPTPAIPTSISSHSSTTEGVYAIHNTTDMQEKFNINKSTDTKFPTLPPLPTRSLSAPFQSVDIFSKLKLNKELSTHLPTAHSRNSGT